ncbi:MAG: response regulator [Deltaproteobacteria bacterium]|nr:response regulator [Deltaproteobacteria bacterium]
MGKRILIVDDDPWICRMVGTMLQQRGHTTQLARDGREGLRAALSFRPDLIITDVLMAGMDGWTLVRTLRSRPDLNMVPVIFLTALNKDEDRILGFRLGADDYLAKPFRFEELDLRVERVLRTADRIREQVQEELSRQQADSNVGLKGDLAHLGVSAILTILEMERKSGILVLRGPTTGRIFMREGRVLAAFLEGQTEPRGADAVYLLLTWSSGAFEFTSLDVDMEDQVKTSTTHLLMEGARRIDESEAI